MNAEQAGQRAELLRLADADLHDLRHLADAQLVGVEPRSLGQFALGGQRGRLFKFASKEAVLMVDRLLLGPLSRVLALPGDEPTKRRCVYLGLLGVLDDGGYVFLVGVRQCGQPLSKVRDVVAVGGHADLRSPLTW